MLLPLSRLLRCKAVLRASPCQKMTKKLIQRFVFLSHCFLVFWMLFYDYCGDAFLWSFFNLSTSTRYFLHPSRCCTFPHQTLNYTKYLFLFRSVDHMFKRVPSFLSRQYFDNRIKALEALTKAGISPYPPNPQAVMPLPEYVEKYSYLNSGQRLENVTVSVACKSRDFNII